ncbi:MAG TPA: TolC family protein [Vicinamibacterales bacterium]|jgi:outer membrane protein|nr:TolC family protein [Vicinamibacterales bacterium]
MPRRSHIAATRPRWYVLFIVIVGTMRAAVGAAQSLPLQPRPPQALTIEQAIRYARDHYPTVRAALEQVNASAAGVDVARSAYLPRLDSLWQSHRATANNIFGQLLPQSVLPAISGPVLPSSSDSMWSSATGALFSWELFDFGLRHASVANAEAGLTRTMADRALTGLEVEGAVADAFLGVIAAQRAVAAAQADVDRRDVLRRAVQTLVDNQLRPGAEASRAEAERAAAQTRLIQAQQTLALAQALLLRVLGMTSGSVVITGDTLTQLPSGDLGTAPASAHPLAQLHEATVDQSRAIEAVLARTDEPHVYLQSSVFARGSGANANGTLSGGIDGLGLERVNWAAGVQVTFPNMFDWSSLRARKAAAAASTRAEAALYDEALLTITNQQQAATAQLNAARAIAANTPVQLAAAQQTESQSRTRYDAGLATIIEVADAQSLLAQAEVQDQLARVDVWRALLATAIAQGDISRFVALLPQP